MWALKNITWLLKARNKNTSIFLFTKKKKLTYVFHQQEHHLKEHY